MHTIIIRQTPDGSVVSLFRMTIIVLGYSYVGITPVKTLLVSILKALAVISSMGFSDQSNPTMCQIITKDILSLY